MKPQKIKILVADDHPYIRDGIVSLVATESDLQVVAQAGDGAEAVALAKAHQPDIVLLDLRMPQMDGLEVLERIQSLGLACKVVVLTTYESEQDILLALKKGARGYLLKDTPRPMLLDALRRVQRGETSIPPRISQKLVETMNRLSLSVREIEVVKHIAEGKSNKDIANELHIAQNTVKAHVKSILKKLNVPGRTAAVKEAVHRGLIRLA